MFGEERRGEGSLRGCAGAQPCPGRPPWPHAYTPPLDPCQTAPHGVLSRPLETNDFIPPPARNHCGLLPSKLEPSSLYSLCLGLGCLCRSAALSPCRALAREGQQGGRPAPLSLVLPAQSPCCSCVASPAGSPWHPTDSPWLVLCVSPLRVRPPSCSSSPPCAPAYLSADGEGSSKGFVQRPRAKEDKWNLQ